MCPPASDGDRHRGRVARCLSPFVPLVLAALATACSSPHPAAPPRQLRVCADPNNLPFSNDRLEGFENRIAALVGRDMHATVSYTWWAQRRGFIRNTLAAGRCDVVVGVPARFELTLTTRPYYRSSYVFVSRADRARQVASFDDPALRRLKIGVQMIGDDYSNSPPAHALAERHIISNVVGYMVYGNYADQNPPARIIEAVARGDLDVAVAWGPLAGYFAARQPVGLRIIPVSPQVDLPSLPFVFDIAMGVRRADKPLKQELDGIIDRRRADIDAILAEYDVPRVDALPPRANGRPEGRHYRSTEVATVGAAPDRSSGSRAAPTPVRSARIAVAEIPGAPTVRSAPRPVLALPGSQP